MPTYALSIPAYAKKYGVSPSTIRNWRNVGHPLDDSAAMQPIIDAMRSRRSVSKTSPRMDDDEQDAPPRYVAPKFSKEGGLAAAIERFRQAEIASAETYCAAIERGAGVRDALNSWVTITDQLRKIEKDNPDILKSNEQTLDASEAQQAWAVQINEFRAALEAVPQRMAIQLEGLDAIAIQGKLEAEIRQIMKVFSA